MRKTFYNRPDHQNPGRSRNPWQFWPPPPESTASPTNHLPLASKYRGFSASEAKGLKALEAENARLKRLLAEKEPEIQAPTEIIMNGVIKHMTFSNFETLVSLRPDPCLSRDLDVR